MANADEFDAAGRSAVQENVAGVETPSYAIENVGASSAAAGTTTTDATVLPAGTADVYPTTAADGTKGVRLHANELWTGRRIFIGNGVGNQILKVYPPTGGNINALGVDAAFSSASGKGVILICLSQGSNTWFGF